MVVHEENLEVGNLKEEADLEEAIEEDLEKVVSINSIIIINNVIEIVVMKKNKELLSSEVVQEEVASGVILEEAP